MCTHVALSGDVTRLHVILRDTTRCDAMGRDARRCVVKLRSVCVPCPRAECLEMAMRDYLAMLRDKWRCYAISRDLMRRYAPCAP